MDIHSLWIQRDVISPFNILFRGADFDSRKYSSSLEKLVLSHGITVFFTFSSNCLHDKTQHPGPCDRPEVGSKLHWGETLQDGADRGAMKVMWKHHVIGCMTCVYIYIVFYNHTGYIIIVHVEFLVHKTEWLWIVPCRAVSTVRFRRQTAIQRSLFGLRP